MASSPHDHVGYRDYVSWICQKLRGVHGCESRSGNHRRRFIARNCEFWTAQSYSVTNEVKVLYLSGMYTRPEMALRIGLFYTAASLSGAFGGQTSFH